jgi:hypothetical protein
MSDITDESVFAAWPGVPISRVTIEHYRGYWIGSC